MSIVMRSAVIRMPFEMAMGTHVSRLQYHNRAIGVLRELEQLEEKYQELVRAHAELKENYDVLDEAYTELGSLFDSMDE